MQICTSKTPQTRSTIIDSWRKGLEAEAYGECAGQPQYCILPASVESALTVGGGDKPVGLFACFSELI